MANMVDERKRDIELWQQWQHSPTERNLGTLLRQVNPLVQKEVNRWSGSLARPLLEIQAKTLAAKAIQTYDPKRGAALGTHITNQLRKLSRLPYTHQNIARIPEYKVLKIHAFNSAQMDLENKLGREPTVGELADQLGWSRAFVGNFQRSLRREFVESGELPPIFDDSKGDTGVIDFVYNDLSPMQQQLFEHSTGYGGGPILDNPGLRKKLKMTQGQLSYQKRLLVNKVHDLTKGGIS